MAAVAAMAASMVVLAPPAATGPAAPVVLRAPAAAVAPANPVTVPQAPHAAQAAQAAPAAQGDLDPSFGGTGQVVTDVSGQLSQADGVAVQADGKVVAVGTTGPGRPGPASDMAVVRYNADGTPDASFGTGGVVTVDLFGDVDQAHAVVVQPDGKILVAGGTAGRSRSRDIAVLRFNADGTRDTGFGNGGWWSSTSEATTRRSRSPSGRRTRPATSGSWSVAGA